MSRDVQYAVRGLRRAPGFTLAVTFSLGLAIGANATIFGAIDGLWLRPPGAKDSNELVRLFSTSDASQDGLWSFPEYEDLRAGTRAFSGVAARGRRGTILQLPDGTTELELVNFVSLNFFSTLGVSPAFGRLQSWSRRVPSFVAAATVVVGIVMMAMIIPPRRAVCVQPSTALGTP